MVRRLIRISCEYIRKALAVCNNIVRILDYEWDIFIDVLTRIGGQSVDTSKTIVIVSDKSEE